ncbi:hypothetical protein [Rhodopseudomonas sp. BAL398]|uniref:hypothetical protein n=1 Tax=Rhodopseudomonas sp. BAL398 TaxID=3034676 RepID=UPI0023E2C1F5|nr:hypothetical protein [Rhodopseudomonas sp. BAL398]MDF3812061.1 hypothetical protein [Rhodopseudomonas sp. BAL398]
MSSLRAEGRPAPPPPPPPPPGGGAGGGGAPPPPTAKQSRCAKHRLDCFVARAPRNDD